MKSKKARKSKIRRERNRRRRRAAEQGRVTLVRPPKCDNCGGMPKRVDSTEVHPGSSYGWIWVCQNYPKCDSYVGCHRDTKMPLGRLADKKTRQARMDCHAAFDPLWRSGQFERKDLYHRLSQKLGIPYHECHFAMFDYVMARRALNIIREIADESSKADQAAGPHTRTKGVGLLRERDVLRVSLPD